MSCTAHVYGNGAQLEGQTPPVAEFPEAIVQTMPLESPQNVRMPVWFGVTGCATTALSERFRAETAR